MSAPDVPSAARFENSVSPVARRSSVERRENYSSPDSLSSTWENRSQEISSSNTPVSETSQSVKTVREESSPPNVDSLLQGEASRLYRHVSCGRLVLLDIYILVVLVAFVVYLLFGANREAFREALEPVADRLLPPWLILLILVVALAFSLLGAWLVARRHVVDQSFKMGFLYAGLFTSLLIWVYFLFYYGVDNQNFYWAIFLNVLAILFALGIMAYNLMVAGTGGFLQILLVVALFYVLFATLILSGAVVQ